MKLQGSFAAMTLAWVALSVSACGDDDKSDGGSARTDGGLDATADACVSCDAGPDIDAAPDAGGSDSGAHDGGRPDGSTSDASEPDTGVADAGTSPSCSASAAPVIPTLRLAPVPGVDGLSDLVFAAQPPGSPDWYLVQHSGRIRVLADGALKPGNFLDVSSQITLGNSDDERGLLGLAFPPDYASTGKLYVMMTPTSGPNANRDVVLEYTRDGEVAGSTAREILALPASPANHNGGHIVFGPDGYLYVGTGDGGFACSDFMPTAPQDVGSLFGKILRLDPSVPAPHAAPGNPFATGGDARVYHYGLRNPYRFAFDRLTDDLFIGDVGQNAYEEVSFAARGTSGLNFGWPAREGSHAPVNCSTKPLRPDSTATEPIVDIDRQAGATGPFSDYRSVISGPVYRGSAIPALQGVYIFGDYVGTRMGALYQCATTSPVTPILKNANPNTPNVRSFSKEAGQPTFVQLTAIVEDGAGELYFVANRNALLKVVPE